MNFREIGLGNSKNFKDNYLKLPAKSAMQVTPKLYEVNHASTTATVTRVTLDGVEYTLDTPIVVTETNDVVAAIYTIMQNHTQEIVNPVLSARHDGTSIYIFYAGNVSLDVVRFGTTNKTPTVKSTIFEESLFEFEVTPSQTGYVMTNGANSATFDAGANEAATKTAVDTALGTAGVTFHESVVVPKAGSSDLVVKVYVEGKMTPFAIDGVGATYVTSYPNFK